MNPRLAHYTFRDDVDQISAVGELSADLENSVALALLDLEEGPPPGFTSPSEIEALKQLLSLLSQDEEEHESFRLTFNHLIAYLVLLNEVWDDWINDSVATGTLVLGDKPYFQTDADGYAEMQERHAHPIDGCAVLNRVTGPVPCFVERGQLAGIWVPIREEWDSYIKSLRETQEG